VCCAGTFPCCGCEQPKPEVCLICEAAFCLPMAISGNRFMAQTRFDLKNRGPVDACGVKLQCCIAGVCGVGRLCYDFSEEQENICKSNCCVLPATLCQNASQMNHMMSAGIRYSAPPAGVVNELPVHFSNVGIRATTMVTAPGQQKMATK